MRKVVAFEQQRLTHRFGESVGEAVAKIQPGGMATASPEIALGGAGDLGLLQGDWLRHNFRLDDQLVESPRQKRVAVGVDGD